MSSLLRPAALARLEPPSTESLAAMLRRACLSRGVSVDEDALFTIAEERPDWAGSRNGFEQVAMAIEAEMPPMSPADVRAILEGRWFGLDTESRSPWDVDAVGRRIVRDVLDEVMPRAIDARVSTDPSDANLDDGWTPPPVISSRGDLSLVEKPAPSRTPLLDKTHLVPQTDSRLDAIVDVAFDRVEEDLHRRRFELREIESELVRIRSRIGLADGDETVALTDRLLALEGHLDRIAELPLGHDEPGIEPFQPPNLIMEHAFKILEPIPGDLPFNVKKRAPDGITRIKRRFILTPEGGLSPIRTRLVSA